MSLLDNVLLGTYLRTRSGFLAGALRLDRAEEARARAEALRQLERVGLAPIRTNRPAICRSAASASSRSPARWPPIRRSSCSTSRPPACAGRKRRALAELLRALRAEGVTILLVEHDMEFVMGLVDRIVVMDFGSKLVEGTPAAVRARSRACRKPISASVA